jgi:hypothetical protein
MARINNLASGGSACPRCMPPDHNAIIVTETIDVTVLGERQIRKRLFVPNRTATKVLCFICTDIGWPHLIIAVNAKDGHAKGGSIADLNQRLYFG